MFYLTDALERDSGQHAFRRGAATYSTGKGAGMHGTAVGDPEFNTSTR